MLRPPTTSATRRRRVRASAAAILIANSEDLTEAQNAGATAAFSGTRVKPEMSAAPAWDVCAVGNILASARVPPAMLHAFQADPSAPLAERLLQALEEGLAAGGEHVPVRSAHLLVVEHESFPLIDLRVDWHDMPIAELRALWRLYAPQSNDYLLRALDPDNPTII